MQALLCFEESLLARGHGHGCVEVLARPRIHGRGLPAGKALEHADEEQADICGGEGPRRRLGVRPSDDGVADGREAGMQLQPSGEAPSVGDVLLVDRLQPHRWTAASR